MTRLLNWYIGKKMVKHILLQTTLLTFWHLILITRFSKMPHAVHTKTSMVPYLLLKQLQNLCNFLHLAWWGWHYPKSKRLWHQRSCVFPVGRLSFAAQWLSDTITTLYLDFAIQISITHPLYPKTSCSSPAREIITKIVLMISFLCTLIFFKFIVGYVMLKGHYLLSGIKVWVFFRKKHWKKALVPSW